ncbi:hypothetical protein GCM10020254_04510 [Streptomyces goshikiensis]
MATPWVPPMGELNASDAWTRPVASVFRIPVVGSMGQRTMGGGREIEGVAGLVLHLRRHQGGLGPAQIEGGGGDAGAFGHLLMEAAVARAGVGVAAGAREDVRVGAGLPDVVDVEDVEAAADAGDVEAGAGPYDGVAVAGQG